MYSLWLAGADSAVRFHAVAVTDRSLAAAFGYGIEIGLPDNRGGRWVLSIRRGEPASFPSYGLIPRR